MKTSASTMVMNMQHDPSCLDDQSKLLVKFFEKKLGIRKETVSSTSLLGTAPLKSLTSKSSTSNLAPIGEGSASSEAATGEAATTATTATPDTASTVACVDTTSFRVSLRGIQSTARPTAVDYATSPQARANIPAIRSRGTTYSSFQSLHTDMEKSLDAARRHSKTVEKSAKALNKQMMILEQFRAMKKRNEILSKDSVAKSRWKRACHKVIMELAVEKTRQHLLRQQRYTIAF